MGARDARERHLQHLTGWLNRVGPTEGASLLRIALALIAWAQVGDRLSLAHARDGWDVVLAIAFYCASSCMLVGWRGRLAAGATGLALVAIYHHFGEVHGIEALHRHQSWLLASTVLCLSLSPCHQHLSLDRRRQPLPLDGNLWGLRLIALQLSVVYLFGAIDKTNPAFLSGARLEQIFAEHYFGAALPEWLSYVSAPVSVGITIFEYVLAIGLWVPRLRRPLMMLGITMHACFFLLLPVSTFSILSVVLYLAYLEPVSVSIVCASFGINARFGGVDRSGLLRAAGGTSLGRGEGTSACAPPASAQR